MKTNVFSNETLNAAVKVMNESQAEMSKLREQAKNEPINEVAQRYLMDKLSITQSEAEEICNDIRRVFLSLMLNLRQILLTRKSISMKNWRV